MSEILLLNPRRKKRAKKRSTKRTAKRGRRRAAPRRRTTKRAAPRRAAAKRTQGVRTMRNAKRRRTTRRRRAPRRNPSRRRSNPRRITRRAGAAIAGLNIRTALGNVPIHVAGMMAAKWAAKRFGGASETDPASWTWASYLKGSLGAAAGGILANQFRRGWGQKVLEGGLSLMVYKALQNELIVESPWATSQFGYDGYGAERTPGTIEENDEGEPFILGDDYQWYPLEGADDSMMGYIPDYAGYGDDLVTPGPLGDDLVTPGPLGFGEPGASFLRR